MAKEVTTIVPFEIGLIDEGQFLKNLNAALLNAQQQLIAHVKRYGPAAIKAKAGVKAEIVLICSDPKDDAYACLSQIKTSMPVAPPTGNFLVGGTTQTGEPCLLCRKTGAGEDNPNQRILCTEAGQDVDLDTGEISTEDT